jgi:hypothetical protein
MRPNTRILQSELCGTAIAMWIWYALASTAAVLAVNSIRQSETLMLLYSFSVPGVVALCSVVMVLILAFDEQGAVSVR